MRIKAAIDGDHLHEDLRSQLTKELQAEVLPQLKALHAEMEGFNEEMGKVTSRSFEEMATHAGIASKEVEEVGKATRTASRAEVTYRNQVRTTGKAIKARSDAARKYREEIRANGVAQTETERDYWLAAEKAYNAIIKRDTAYAEWQAKLENIERRRTKAQEDHARAVLKANDAEAQGYRDLIKNAMGASDAIIKDAVNRSNLQIKEHQRVADSFEAIEDPAARLATGVRMWIRYAHENPDMGRFAVRFGQTAETLRAVLAGPTMHDLGTGFTSGRFPVDAALTPNVATLIIGGTISAMWMVLEGHQTWREAGSATAELLLRALGVDAAEARDISRIPLPELRSG